MNGSSQLIDKILPWSTAICSFVFLAVIVAAT